MFDSLRNIQRRGLRPPKMTELPESGVNFLTRCCSVSTVSVILIGADSAVCTISWNYTVQKG